MPANTPPGVDTPTDALEAQLLATLRSHDLTRHRALISQIAAQHRISILDCAAALAHALIGPLAAPVAPTPPQPPAIGLIRYRLEVGHKQHLTEEALIVLLIEESGVDPRLIGPIHIHAHHTLVALPDGMPGEIFQHLKTVQFNDCPLRIKRADDDPPLKRPRRSKRRKTRRTNETGLATSANLPAKS